MGLGWLGLGLGLRLGLRLVLGGWGCEGWLRAGGLGWGWAGLGWKGVVRGQEFCDWNLISVDLNLVFVTGTWFWVGLGLKLTV